MKLFKFINYKLNMFFRSSNCVMPLIALFIFLGIMYSSKPVDFLGSSIVSGVCCFYLMIWIGMTISLKENSVNEQILFFRMKTFVSYFIAKTLFLILIAGLTALICTLYPCMQGIINGDMFVPGLTALSIVNGFLINLSNALAGVTLGNIFYKGFTDDKKMAIGVCVLVAIVAICKEAIIKEWAVTRFILWIVPSVLMSNQMYPNTVEFDVVKTITIFAVLSGYAVIYSIIKGILSSRRPL